MRVKCAFKNQHSMSSINQKTSPKINELFNFSIFLIAILLALFGNRVFHFLVVLSSLTTHFQFSCLPRTHNLSPETNSKKVKFNSESELKGRGDRIVHKFCHINTHHNIFLCVHSDEHVEITFAGRKKQDRPTFHRGID